MKYLILLVLFGCATQETRKPHEIVYPVNAPIDPEYVINYYVNASTLEWVKDTIKIANCVTNEPNFHKEVLENGKYEHFDGDNQDIVDALLSSKKAEVGTYYKRFTKAVAYRNPGTNKIWFNRKFSKNSSGASKLNTMIHERLHVLGFGHKGNSKYKYNNVESVPYKVGKIAQGWYETCK